MAHDWPAAEIAGCSRCAASGEEHKQSTKPAVFIFAISIFTTFICTTFVYTAKEKDPMTTLENKQLVQDIFANLAQGNPKPLFDSMAEDFRWTVSGNTKWSRTYNGKQVVLKELLGPLHDMIVDKVRTNAQRFIAEGEHVVVEARGSNQTKTGAAYNNTYCFVIRLDEGKLREITEYMDTELVTAVLGDPRGHVN